MQDGGCGFDLISFQHQGKIKGLYPLHIDAERDRIWENFGFVNNDTKFDSIKDYFGEKIALYFNFVSCAQLVVLSSYSRRSYEHHSLGYERSFSSNPVVLVNHNLYLEYLHA